MKKFTNEEITTLEENLVIMQEESKLVEFGDINQNELDNFVELFNMIVTEYANTQGKQAKVLPELVLAELPEERFKTLSNIMIEASELLVQEAKKNVE